MLPRLRQGSGGSQSRKEVGYLHGRRHSVPLLGPPVLTEGHEHTGVRVGFVGVVVVGQKYFFEFTLVGKERHTEELAPAAHSHEEPAGHSEDAHHASLHRRELQKTWGGGGWGGGIAGQKSLGDPGPTQTLRL